MDSSKVKIKASKEILISMTNIMVAMREAEDSLASNNLAALCENLKKVEQISNSMRRDIETKYGVATR